MTIPVTELARRLCVEAHASPGFAGGGIRPQGVPCATHLNLARQVWGLTDASGAAMLAVINGVASENMIPEVHPDRMTPAR